MQKCMHCSSCKHRRGVLVFSHFRKKLPEKYCFKLVHIYYLMDLQMSSIDAKSRTGLT